MTSYSTKIYNILSWIDDPISNIPLKVQIQGYRCLKLDMFRFIFRQWVLEECILPSLYVWPRIPRKYTIFQVGLTLHLVIFLSKYKYKDTDVWNLTYSVLFFGSGFLKNAFCLVLKFDLIFHENIQYFKLDWRSN